MAQMADGGVPAEKTVMLDEGVLESAATMEARSKAAQTDTNLSPSTPARNLFLRGNRPLSDEVADLAKRYLVPIGEGDIRIWTNQIESGSLDPEAFIVYLKTQAAGMYPQFAQLIANGVEPRLLFAPYEQVVQRELGPETDLTAPNVQEALMASKNVSEFRAFLRQQSEWESGPMANQLLSRFVAGLAGRSGQIVEPHDYAIEAPVRSEEGQGA